MKRVKHITGIIIYIVVFAFLLKGLSGVFADKKIVGIKSEEDNTIDYLVVGDSEAYSSISPMEIWEEKGFTGYNLGKPSITIQRSYKIFLDAIENQSPKVVLVESNFLFRNKGMVNDFDYFFGNLLTKHFGIFETHSNWKTMLSNIINRKNEGVVYILNPLKGYSYIVDTKPYTKGDYIVKTNKRATILPQQKSIFDDFVNTCKENNIQMILYSIPSPHNWSYARHNVLSDLAHEHSIEFLDLNFNVSDIGINWAKDTYDAGDHMNYHGAKKVTKYIANYFEKNTSLTSKKGNKDYAKWDVEFDEYAVIRSKNVNRRK